MEQSISSNSIDAAAQREIANGHANRHRRLQFRLRFFPNRLRESSYVPADFIEN